jgi:dienelactone hydrolase
VSERRVNELTGERLRNRLMALLDFCVPSAPPLEILDSRTRDGYSERLVSYVSPDRENIPAFLLVPTGDGPFPAVVAYHQHRREWHFGKSEVAGLVGDQLQAFGPALARRGLIVLAPDAVCFEDRRRTGPGTEPRGERDSLQHYNEMSNRLLHGGTLMTTVVNDAAAAVSVLLAMEVVDAERVGVLGHSYGGTTALFHTALDARVRFACASGAACTYRRRIADGTPIDFSQVIPGILPIADLDDIVALIAPRPALLVSATDDRYSKDADDIARAAAARYASFAAPAALTHERFQGGHGITGARFQLIVHWTASQVASA